MKIIHFVVLLSVLHSVIGDDSSDTWSESDNPHPRPLKYHKHRSSHKGHHQSNDFEGNVVKMSHSSKSSSQTCGYKACNLGKADMLNVHLVPHTHDDVGWIRTVDQYYYGVGHAGVQYILDTTIEQLRQDPAKRFIYVEIAFFYRWWNEQHDSMRHIVKGLVNQGRLEFILGGWCMNDEASTHYNAIIDQHTVGFRFIQRNFGECGRPRIGWQIDPFGHSREQASLFAQFGFDGLFFGRLDYQDKAQRLENKTMELMWMASSNLDDAAALFTGVNQNGYSAPSGFCFDPGCKDTPIMDDPQLDEYNVEEKVKLFLKAARDQSDHYSTNHIMFTMGDDFEYENALHNFKNIDKSIKYVNDRSDTTKVNLLYSTPSCYLYALNQANQSYTAKHDDFFPYADKAHSFWTGYFTSRPALKRYVRDTNNFLQVCKQLDVLSNLGPEYGGALKLDILRKAMGVAQHHDAVSGTETQDVAYDYAKRLAKGVSACQDVVNYALSKLLPPPGGKSAPIQTFCPLLNVSNCHFTEKNTPMSVLVYNPTAHERTHMVRLPVIGSKYTVLDSNLTSVPNQITPLTKHSIPDRAGSKANGTLNFEAVLPPLGFATYFITPATVEETERDEPTPDIMESHTVGRSSIRLRWMSLGSEYLAYSVHYRIASASASHELQRVVTSPYLTLNNLRPGTSYEIYVVAYSNTHVSPPSAKVTIRTQRRSGRKQRNRSKTPQYIENEHMRITVSGSTGLLNTITPTGSNVPLHINQKLLYYKAFLGNNSVPEFQASGAYVFRPNGSIPIPVPNGRVKTTMVQGELVSEIHQVFSEWASQTIRLYKDSKWAEFEWTVGPIPVDDGIGKEVISEFTTDLNNKGVFYTDSNGREILKRVRDFRPTWKLNQTEPISGNYYPVNSRIYIRDEAKKLQLTVLTDRSQGGSSIHDGQIELMVHRRLLVDDAFGVGEPLNEPGLTGKGLVVSGTHYVCVSSIEESASLHRDKAQGLYMAPVVSFSDLHTSPQTYKNTYNTQWSGFQRALPDNVHLLTLEEWEANSFLLRLEHFYEINEDDKLSKDASVSLKDLFAPLTVESIEELILGANQPLKDAQRLSWRVNGRNTNGNMASAVTPVDPKTLGVTLKPMQIRTFQVFFQM